MKLEEAIKTVRFTNKQHKAVLQVYYTAWWYKSIVNKSLKHVGLTHEQFNVLRILKGKHPESMRVKDIAERVIEQNSNIPRIIDKLILKKLIKKDKHTLDGRASVINLTQTGVLLLEKANEITNTKFNTINLSDIEAENLDTLLEKMKLKNKEEN